MATMAQMREALATTLATLPNVQESAYLLSNPTPPAAEIEPAPIDYDLAMQRGLDKWMFTIRVFVGLTTDIGAQTLLDTFLDPTGTTSIKTAVEKDRTLSGLVDNVRVTRSTGYRSYERAGSLAPILGAEWTVEILASN